MQYVSIIKDDLDLSSSPQRYLRLPHPRTALPQLYLPYSANSRDCILEVNKIQCSSRRTWFIGDNQIEAGTILIHHPIDPLFLVIPIISELLKQSTGSQFQPLSDLIISASSLSAFSLPEAFSTASTSAETPAGRAQSGQINEDVSRLLGIKSVRKVFRLCCERKVIPTAPPSPSPQSCSSSSVPASSRQIYYRPSLPRVIALLQTKVEYFSNVEQFEQFDHLVRGLSKDGLLSSDSKTDESSDIQQDLISAARLKMTCEHLGQWLSPQILSALMDSYDVMKLSEYLANRTAAALAAQAPVVNVKKADKGAAKRKAPAGSRGVEALKKVNTSSMSKMTSFFRPKEGKK